MVDFSKYSVQNNTAIPTTTPTLPVSKPTVPVPGASVPVIPTPTAPTVPVASKFAKYGTPTSESNSAPAVESKPSTLGTLLGPTKEGISGLKTLYGGSEQGIANKLANDVSEGAKDLNGPMGVKQLLGPTKAGLRVAGDVAGTIFAPVGAAIGATGIGKVFDWIGAQSQKGGKFNPINLVTDNPAVQKYVITHPNTGEDFGRALNLIMAAGDPGKIEPKTAIERTVPQVENALKSVAEKGKVMLPSEAKTNEKIIAKRVKELETLDSTYAKNRKANAFSKDEGAGSRQRVASTDVLANAVDENGVIRTVGKGRAIDQYKAMTLDGAEGVVRTNLEALGETVPLKTVEAKLTQAVNSSGLEGKDLIQALNSVKKEIAGYKLKADANGDIPLTLVHDAKINTTNNIDFNTPAETATYRKAVARALKETVEENSKFNVKEVNDSLSPFLKDIELLKRLDGERVRGGKLGKYFAQISGNIIGGTAGNMIGGPVGAAAGTILGGELASKIKGSMMEKTLSGETGFKPPRNPVLETAKESAKNFQEKSLGNRNLQYKPTKIEARIPKNGPMNRSIPKNSKKITIPKK